jgi:outer membrane autotransporter protein
MHIGSNSIGSLQSLIGIQANRRVQINETYWLVPSVHVGWAYEMLDTRARLTASFLGAPGSAFSVANPPIGRSAAVIGAHGILETGTPLQIFFGYDAAFDSKANAQTVSAGFRYTW